MLKRVLPLIGLVVVAYASSSAQSVQLYLMETSTDYHIESSKRRQATSVPRFQAASKMADSEIEPMVVALVTNSSKEYEAFTYVAEASMPVRETPETSAKIVWTMRPLELARVFDIQPGWVRIGSRDMRGWVPGPPSNLIVRDAMDAAKLLVDLARRPAWSVATKHRILRHEPTVGFTDEQVTMSLGESPLSSETEETAKGTTSVRVYRTPIGTFVTVTLTGGRVSSIRRSE